MTAAGQVCNSKTEKYILEKPQCNICFDIASAPFTLTCNHTYCTGCIDLWLGKDIDTCPACRGIISCVDMAAIDDQKFALRSAPFAYITSGTLALKIQSALCELDWNLWVWLLADDGKDGHACKVSGCPCPKSEHVEYLDEKVDLQRRHVAMLFQQKINIMRIESKTRHQAVWHRLRQVLVICYAKRDCFITTRHRIDQMPQGMTPLPVSYAEWWATQIFGLSRDLYYLARFVTGGYQKATACPEECDHSQRWSDQRGKEDYNFIISAVRTLRVGRDIGIIGAVVGVWFLGRWMSRLL